MLSEHQSDTLLDRQDRQKEFLLSPDTCVGTFPNTRSPHFVIPVPNLQHPQLQYLFVMKSRHCLPSDRMFRQYLQTSFYWASRLTRQGNVTQHHCEAPYMCNQRCTASTDILKYSNETKLEFGTDIACWFLLTVPATSKKTKPYSKLTHPADQNWLIS